MYAYTTNWIIYHLRGFLFVCLFYNWTFLFPCKSRLILTTTKSFCYLADEWRKRILHNPTVQHPNKLSTRKILSTAGSLFTFAAFAALEINTQTFYYTYLYYVMLKSRHTRYFEPSFFPPPPLPAVFISFKVDTTFATILAVYILQSLFLPSKHKRLSFFRSYSSKTESFSV